MKNLTEMSDSEYAEFKYMLDTARKLGHLSASSIKPVLETLLDLCLELVSLLKTEALWTRNFPRQIPIFSSDEENSGFVPGKHGSRRISEEITKDPLNPVWYSPGVQLFVNIADDFPLERKASSRLILFFNKLASLLAQIIKNRSLPSSVFLSREEKGQKEKPIDEHRKQTTYAYYRRHRSRRN
jgi:hypothetical protein